MKRAVCIATLLVSLALPAVAPADVDPASDVLLFQNEYFPRVQPPSARLKATLTALTGQANKAGYGIKVAIIGARLDLGGVPQLYRHPEEYARFLGIELKSATGLLQPTVVVMRGGIGLYGTGDEAAAVKGIDVPPKASSDDLTRIAIDATQRLSAAAGHPLTLPKPTKAATKKASSKGAPLLAFMAPVVLLLLVGVLLWQGRRKRNSPA